MIWVRKLFDRLFRRPAPTLDDALEAWVKDYCLWKEAVEQVFNSFPDHTPFEHHRVDEKTAKLLHEISRLYLNDACELVSALSLKGEQLQRHVQGRKARPVLPPEASKQPE
jgi:hypothetical protein